MNPLRWQRLHVNPLPPDVPARLGDYDVRGAIGHGPNGYVCLVADRDGREFAAKVLHPRYADDVERGRRFVREALVARSLVHPPIVRVHRVVPHFDAPLPFYVMDYYPTGHVGTLRGGPLAPTLAALTDACDALQHVHRTSLFTST